MNVDGIGASNQTNNDCYDRFNYAHPDRIFLMRGDPGDAPSLSSPDRSNDKTSKPHQTSSLKPVRSNKSLKAYLKRFDDLLPASFG